MRGAVDPPFQVTDRPRGQARHLRQLLLGQPSLGPQLPQQLREPQARLSATAPGTATATAPVHTPVVTGPARTGATHTAYADPAAGPARQSGRPAATARRPAPWLPGGPARLCGPSRGPLRVVNTAAAANSGISRDSPSPPGPAHQEVTVNSIRRLRRPMARRASSPGRAEPQGRQPGRRGRGRLAGRLSDRGSGPEQARCRTHELSATHDHHARPAAAHHRAVPRTTGETRPDSGSAATAAGRRAAPGARPAASTRTRAPITRSRPMVRTMQEQARRSRAGARLPSSPGAPSDPTAATGSPWPRLTAAPGAGTARRLPAG